MANIEAAEQLLLSAMRLDEEVGETPDWSELIVQVGVQSLHLVYYDGFWMKHPEIIRHLTLYPGGALMGLLRELVEAKAAVDGYSPETLNRMYGLD
jgi:hypothetical protein